MAKAPADLVEAARQGNERALAGLLAHCQPDIRRYARRACATEDVEDAVQDAMLLVFRRLGTLRTLATFSGWLFQIVRRECLRRLRRRQQEPFCEDTHSRFSAASDADLQLDLARAIRALPQTCRDVLILRDINELSAEETAAAAGISVEAVKSRLHRARHALRQQLK